MRKFTGRSKKDFLNFPEINSKNQKYQLLHILWVSRLETWLTVYRALDIILEQFGGSKGVWASAYPCTCKDKYCKYFSVHAWIPERSGHLLECIKMRLMAEVEFRIGHKIRVYSRVQNVTGRSKNEDFLKILRNTRIYLEYFLE